MTAVLVAPDGALIDRVAEFAFEKDIARARTLFETDPDGYVDAVGKFVQTLAFSDKLVGRNGPGLTDATSILKERLAAAHRLEYSEFFEPEGEQERLVTAREWLGSFWDNICLELKNRNSMALTAIIGHLRREAYYCWVLKHEAFTGPRLEITDDEVKHLPLGILERLSQSVKDITTEKGVSLSDTERERWVERNVTMHFRIFAAYWKHFGSDAGQEYMPAFTRSSLRWLTEDFDHESHHSSVARVVMPFVGFAAFKRVRNRRDLVNRVLDWGDGEGRKVVEGIRQLEQNARTIADESEQQQLIKYLKAILASQSSASPAVELNLVKPGTKTYRLLLRIRKRDLRSQWRKRIEDLLA